jgi:hypothetical protein
MNYFTLAILSLPLAACVHQPEMGWIRTDRTPVVPLQFEADEAQCKGEVQKSRAAFTGQIGFSIDQVFIGCMAGKGYVQRPLPQQSRPLGELSGIIYQIRVACPRA